MINFITSSTFLDLMAEVSMKSILWSFENFSASSIVTTRLFFSSHFKYVNSRTFFLSQIYFQSKSGSYDHSHVLLFPVAISQRLNNSLSYNKLSNQ